MSETQFKAVEIRNVPFQKRLYGVSMPVPAGQKPGEVMFKAMDATWGIVRARQIRTTGINHIVYTGNVRVFAGVEVVGAAPPPADLQEMDVEFARYAYYHHTGPYDLLGAVYEAMAQEMAAQNLTKSGKSMEIYGHAKDDPNQQVTEILIGIM